MASDVTTDMPESLHRQNYTGIAMHPLPYRCIGGWMITDYGQLSLPYQAWDKGDIICFARNYQDASDALRR